MMRAASSWKIRAWVVALFVCFALPASAHVGSPDLFFSGSIGPYPARVTIRVPRVIPGRAEISARIESGAPLEVSFLPVYAYTPIQNAPPPEKGQPIPGEANLYGGELWLMGFGAYSVEVRVKGPQGEGILQIPVTSQATRQLPMPSILGYVLSALGCVLVVGAVAIAYAAGREAGLAPAQLPSTHERWKGIAAAATTTIVLTTALFGGWHWWKSEERGFREHLREGAWPDLSAEVLTSRDRRVLRLNVGAEASRRQPLSFIPDHGKLIHLFLIKEGSRDAFAHIHPVRKEGTIFEVTVPPLPAGRYTVFCDLSYEGGSSSTASTSVELPPIPVTTTGAAPVPDVSSPTAATDPDDSWASYPADTVPLAAAPAPQFRMQDGTTVTWKCQKPIRAGRDASLRFELADGTGKPLALEPYMGMLSHAAVLRNDGAVFAHLHPSGNYSMAAQSFFAAKMARELSGIAEPAAVEMDHSHMHHGDAAPVSSVDLPYEFPEPGAYRIWVQFKTGGRIVTGVFDAQVEL